VNAPPSVQARRGRPGYDREGLLDVAVEVFNDRGYDATTMEDLSRRLGITKSAIYHHVDGKEELLQLALDRALDGLFAVVAEVEASDRSAVDRLEHVLRGSIRVLSEELHFVHLLLHVHGNTDVERAALARRRRFDGIVADLVRQAAREGDLRPDVDPDVTSRLLFGMVNSLVEWYRPRGSTDIAQMADAVATIAFEGIRS
jgi:AcrR family transcriptional regulator